MQFKGITRLTSKHNGFTQNNINIPSPRSVSIEKSSTLKTRGESHNKLKSKAQKTHIFNLSIRPIDTKKNILKTNCQKQTRTTLMYLREYVDR